MRSNTLPERAGREADRSAERSTARAEADRGWDRVPGPGRQVHLLVVVVRVAVPAFAGMTIAFAGSCGHSFFTNLTPSI